MEAAIRRYEYRIALVTLALFFVTVFSMFSGCSCLDEQVSRSASKPASAAKPAPVTCPLCGREVTDAGVVKRRPVAIKVENDPAARPLSGLESACVVYEEITEGGITRFMAMYLCTDADPVGPVRSARPVDVELVYPYGALFAHCGGGKPIIDLIEQSGIADMDEQKIMTPYWRSRDRASPHNLYTSTAQLRQEGETAYPSQGEVKPPFLFLSQVEVERLAEERQVEIDVASEAAARSAPGAAEERTPSLVVINDIDIPYIDICAVHYSYDSGTRRFMRFVAGKPQLERASENQLAADNVIVQYITEAESGIVDVRGSESPALGVVGSGNAQVFTLGRLIDATWQKSSREEHAKFFDAAGNELRLKPGTTWIELVPVSTPASVG